MEMITINTREIPIKIVKTNNKNTYYRFKKEGYIQINLSKYQSKKEAINFVKIHSNKFLKKMEQIQQKISVNDNEYMFLNQIYQKVISPQNKTLSIVKDTINLPSENTDQHIKKFEKKEMLQILETLWFKHQNTPFINIENITLKTRHMTSRHGSCNASKRIININTNLIHFDPLYIEYVFLHEISHFVYQNHSKDFYLLFSKLCPNYKQIRKDLKSIYR